MVTSEALLGFAWSVRDNEHLFVNTLNEISLSSIRLLRISITCLRRQLRLRLCVQHVYQNHSHKLHCYTDRPTHQ